MIKIFSVVITALVLTFGSVCDADTVVQTVNLSADNTDDLFSESMGVSTVFELVDDEFFSLTANPFDSSLGNLVSFTASFAELTISGNGTAGANFANGSSALSGPFTINGISFSGAGNSNSQLTEAEGDPVEFGSSVSLTQTFFVADAGLEFDDPAAIGTPFDPAILAAVTGTAPFEVAFDSNGIVTLNSAVDVFAEATGTISLSFHFEPAPTPTPEPSSAVVAVLGLVAMAARRRRA